jgi:ABC-type bacteriocin/lantibiotic exporter with double-glycine peptidase domain
MRVFKSKRWRTEFLITFSENAASFFIIFGFLLPFFFIFILSTKLFFLAFMLIPFLILLTLIFIVIAYAETRKRIELENKELVNNIKGNYNNNVKNK